MVGTQMANRNKPVPSALALIFYRDWPTTPQSDNPRHLVAHMKRPLHFEELFRRQSESATDEFHCTRRVVA